MSASVYKLAASIIRKSDSKRGSIKSLVFNSNSTQKKRLYALVCKTLKGKKTSRDCDGHSVHTKANSNIDLH